MKLLILGHGHHGKGTAAEFFKEITGLDYLDSSWAAAEMVVFPVLGPKYGYETVEECHADRRSKRIEWRDLITAYNTPDKSRLATEILEKVDVYVGMRCPQEFEASKHLFDNILWIDASEREREDPSMGIMFDSRCMTWISNNRDVLAMYDQIEALCP